MFTNLIESDSHRKEFKRRSSFFLATIAAYSLILFAAAIVGVLAYDAKVEAQNMDLVIDMWIPPVKPVTPDGPQPVKKAPPSTTNRISPQPTRPVLYESASNPTKPPDTVSADPNPIPPATHGAIEAPYVSDPPAAASSACDNCSGTNTQATSVVETHTPTPEPVPVKPPTQRVSTGVLLAKIIDLPRPAYPVIARQTRTQGAVNVQILVDESGKVISAQAVTGNAMLVHAAEDAARHARFTATILNNQPVKVQGVITYNFVLQ